MYYTYVLQSEKDGKFYVGFTQDLRNRIALHDSRKARATVGRRPLSLVYYEACLNRTDAMEREKYLKTGYGRRFLNRRLAKHLSGP